MTSRQLRTAMVATVASSRSTPMAVHTLWSFGLATATMITIEAV
jgi:hypothetical protein